MASTWAAAAARFSSALRRFTALRPPPFRTTANGRQFGGQLVQLRQQRWMRQQQEEAMAEKQFAADMPTDHEGDVETETDVYTPFVFEESTVLPDIIVRDLGELPPSGIVPEIEHDV